MTVTCTAVEVVSAVSTNNQASLLTALENVRGNRTTVLPEQAQEATQVAEDTLTGTPAHNRQQFRLGPGEDLSAAVDALTNVLGNNPTIDWYEVRSHECHHDLSTGVGTAPCPSYSVAQDSGGTPATNGTVPDEV